MELIKRLAMDLGVTETQARGGAGLLFRKAKEKLGKDDFARVAAAIPGVDDLLNEAPPGGPARSDDLGRLYTLIGSESGASSRVVAGFLKLGMESRMVGKFVRVILSYAKSSGGEDVKILLEEAIG